MPFTFPLIILSPDLSTMKRFSILQNVHLSHKNLHILKKLQTWLRVELKCSHEGISWKKRNKELMCFCFLVDKSFPQQMKMAESVHMGSQRTLTAFFLWKSIDFENSRILFQTVSCTEISAQAIKLKKLSRFSKSWHISHEKAPWKILSISL